MAKGSQSTDRASIRRLTEIVNVGKSVAEDLGRIGVHEPQQLIGRDPWQLYQKICVHDRVVQDPCLLDVLMSAVDYMNGKSPQKWWQFTARRKRVYGERLQKLALRGVTPMPASRTKKRRGQTTTA